MKSDLHTNDVPVRGGSRSPHTQAASSLSLSMRLRVAAQCVSGALLAGALANMPASAAPVGASLFATGATMPAAIVRAGASLWVSDHTLGFCRIAGSAIDQNSCVLGGASAPGQAVYHSTSALGAPEEGDFYVPDLSSKSQGVYRYTYRNGAITGVSVMAPRAGLGGNRPLAVAWGPDGKVYVAFSRNSNIVRIRLDNDVVEAVGSASGRGPAAMAFIDTTLYLAEATGLTQIANAGGCSGGCRPTAVQGTGVAAPVYVTSDGAALFLADLGSYYRYSPADRCAVRLASGFTNLSALGIGIDGTNKLIYSADDPSAGNLSFQASLYKSSLDSGATGACTGTGGDAGGGTVDVPPPLPSGATLVASGATGPAALVQAGTDLWVSDHALGFCRVASGAIDQTSCVLGGAVAPGQAAFLSAPVGTDLTAGFFYVPDLSSKSRGVYQYTYRGGQIVAVGLVAPNAGLGGNLPQALAVSTDGKLYISFKRTNTIVRVNLGSQTAQTVGTVSGRAGPPAIALMDDTLYLAENAGLTQITGVPGCTGGCRALAVQGASIVAPVYVTADAAAHLLYLADYGSVYRFTPSQPWLGSVGMSSGASGLTALGVGVSGSDNVLYLGDDITAGAQVAKGRITQIRLPAP